MANLTTITERFALTSQALATLGADPAWDSSIFELLRLESLVYADDEFGDYGKACNEDNLEIILLEEKFGKNIRQNPEGAELWGRRSERMSIAEEKHNEAYLYPLWEAQRRLALTPAPTLAAAIFKTNYIARDEVWNDTRMEADCMALVVADFARLAGER